VRVPPELLKVTRAVAPVREKLALPAEALKVTV
jgi:hypothetical protein